MKTVTIRNLQRKARSSSFNYINTQLGVLPILKLILAHPKFAAFNTTQTHIALAQFKIAKFKTHGL